MNKRTAYLTSGAAICAMYVVLTLISNALGLSNGMIQLRLSEMLCALPLLTWAAVPGLTLGCLLANILTGCVMWDVIFGSLATLAGALGTYYIGKAVKGKTARLVTGLAAPVISNTAIIPLVLEFAYGLPYGFLYFAVTVGAGEILSAGVLGALLYKVIGRTHIFDQIGN